MRINWKLLAGFSLFGAVVSLISGIAAGNPFGIILLRLFLSALTCGGLGLVAQAVLERYLPELWPGPGAAKTGPAEARSAGAVDIIIDDELISPLADEERQGEEPAARSAQSGPITGRQTREPEEMYDMEPGGSAPHLEADEELGGMEGGEFDRSDARADAPAAAASPLAAGEALGGDFEGDFPPAERRRDPHAGGEADLDALPDIDALEDGPVSGAAADSASPGLGGDDPPARRTPTTPRELRKAQIEDTVRDQDPEDLAKAVRTFLKKEQ